MSEGEPKFEQPVTREAVIDIINQKGPGDPEARAVYAKWAEARENALIGADNNEPIGGFRLELDKALIFYETRDFDAVLDLLEPVLGYFYTHADSGPAYLEIFNELDTLWKQTVEAMEEAIKKLKDK